MHEPRDTHHEHGCQGDCAISLPTWRDSARRVRRRGLSSHRGRERKYGMTTKAIRNLLVAGGAGERPAKSSLTRPMCALPAGSPQGRACARLAYTCAKKVHAVSRYAGDCPRALAGAVSTGRLIRIVARACVLCGDRAIVLRLHRRFGRSVCQPFFPGRNAEDLLRI
jgi:hypothetical protein